MPDSVRTSNKLRAERDRFVAFAFAAADLLIELDGDLNVRFAAGATGRLIGGRQENLLGRPFLDLVTDDYRQRLRNAFAAISSRGRIGPLPVNLLPASGEPHRVEIYGARLPDSGDSIYVTLREISPVEAAVATGRKPLGDIAGLLDKKDFGDVAAKALRASYDRDQPLAMSLIELKGLGELRDRLEDRVSETLLQDIGRDLRETSVDGASAGQIEDEKFGVVHDQDLNLGNVTDGIADRAQRVDPAGAGVDVRTGTVTLGGDPGRDRENAQALLYAINRFGREHAEFTLDELTRGSRRTLADTVQRIGAFRTLIAENNFDPVFQPIVDLDSRKVHHYEALARFHGADPDSSPFDQITFAENVGLIADFDIAMCRRVIRKIEQAQTNRENLRIGVNLSGRSLETPAFLDHLKKLLAANPSLPDHLLFEVTESSKIDDLEATNNFLNRLRADGYKVCLDDFGAGAAAFHYLRAFDVDFVKIDGAYVKDALKRAEALPYLRAIAKLCEDLGIETIGEMIEDEETARLLQDLNVRLGQGYLLGRPKAGLSGIESVPSATPVRTRAATG